MSSHRQPESLGGVPAPASGPVRPRRPVPAWVTTPPPGVDAPTPAAPVPSSVTTTGLEARRSPAPPVLDPHAVAPDYPPVEDHLPPAPTSPVVHSVPLDRTALEDVPRAHVARPEAPRPVASAPLSAAAALAAPSTVVPQDPAPAAPPAPRGPAVASGTPTVGAPPVQAAPAAAPRLPFQPLVGAPSAGRPAALAPGSPRFSVPGLEHVVTPGAEPTTDGPVGFRTPFRGADAHPVVAPSAFDAVLQQSAPTSPVDLGRVAPLVPGAAPLPTAALPVVPGREDLAPEPTTDEVPAPTKAEQRRASAAAKRGAAVAERAAAAARRAEAKAAKRATAEPTDAAVAATAPTTTADDVSAPAPMAIDTAEASEPAKPSKASKAARASKPAKPSKADRDAARTAAKAEREHARAAAKAEREHARATAKADRDAARTAAKAEREQARATAKADRAAGKAAAVADRAAARTTAKAERAAAEDARVAEAAGRGTAEPVHVDAHAVEAGPQTAFTPAQTVQAHRLDPEDDTSPVPVLGGGAPAPRQVDTQVLPAPRIATAHVSASAEPVGEVTGRAGDLSVGDEPGLQAGPVPVFATRRARHEWEASQAARRSASPRQPRS